MTPRLERARLDLLSCDACGCEAGDPHPNDPSRSVALRVATRHAPVAVCEPCLDADVSADVQTLESLVLSASRDEQQRLYERLAAVFSI